MSTLFHLRLGVRKVQDYIFQVPKLKFMLGANSKIGELFSVELPKLMPTEEGVYNGSKLQELPVEIGGNFRKNFISSSGGHFEALFRNKEVMDDFTGSVARWIAEELPDLEYAITWREFQDDVSYRIFNDETTSQPCSIKLNLKTFFDMPYFQLCEFDGQSVGTRRDKDKVLGSKALLMFGQADKFYDLATHDAVSRFYKGMGIGKRAIADELSELSKQGISLKNNMLAYLKIDGNGTGARFRKELDNLNETNVLDAFIEIEKFWDSNRNQLLSALKTTLETVIPHKLHKKLPYLILMLGGDDLFIVCVPELAMDIALKMAAATAETTPVSVGIAYVKDTYPIFLANHLAESCLESAKAGSYMHGEARPPYIDWHVHFDSVYQDIADIRQASYMLQYQDNVSEITELLTKRPYSLAEAGALLKNIKELAAMLDKPEGEAANNKIKSYRSVLKNGYRDLEFYNKMISKDELSSFFEYHEPKANMRIDSSLDLIELLEIYRKNPAKGGAEHAEHSNNM